MSEPDDTIAMPKVPARSSVGEEIGTMYAIAVALERLSPPARARVLRWVEAALTVNEQPSMSQPMEGK